MVSHSDVAVWTGALGPSVFSTVVTTSWVNTAHMPYTSTRRFDDRQSMTRNPESRSHCPPQVAVAPYRIQPLRMGVEHEARVRAERREIPFDVMVSEGRDQRVGGGQHGGFLGAAICFGHRLAASTESNS